MKGEFMRILRNIFKQYWFILFVVFLLIWVGIVIKASAVELKSVEKLTELEKLELVQAKNKFYEAQNNLEKVKNDIAKSHKMLGESYMEWRSWYEINGDYILYYYQSFMDNSFFMGR